MYRSGCDEEKVIQLFASTLVASSISLNQDKPIGRKEDIQVATNLYVSSFFSNVRLITFPIRFPHLFPPVPPSHRKSRAIAILLFSYRFLFSFSTRMFNGSALINSTHTLRKFRKKDTHNRLGYSRWMPNCSFGAGTAWQSRCATSINALARYTPFFCFPIIGLYFFFRENCEKRAVSFFRVKRYCNMYIYILIEPDPEFNLTEWTSKSNHKLEINWTRPHNGTKNGWKEAIRRNGGYKTNRQRSQNRAKLGGTEWGQNCTGRD